MSSRVLDVLHWQICVQAQVHVPAVVVRLLHRGLLLRQPNVGATQVPPLEVADLVHGFILFSNHLVIHCNLFELALTLSHFRISAGSRPKQGLWGHDVVFFEVPEVCWVVDLDVGRSFVAGLFDDLDMRL